MFRAIICLSSGGQIVYTAFGIVTLYKWMWWPCSTQVVYSTAGTHLCPARPPRPLIDSDDTKCYIYTILPPKDEHIIARNMYRNVILCE